MVELPTSLKVFALMTVALLPLGLIALLASLQADRSADETRRADLRIAVGEAARKLQSELGADLAIARGAAEGVATPADARIACFRLDMTFAARPTTRPLYALFGPDRTIACASPGFTPPPPPMSVVQAEPSLRFAADGVAIAIADPKGRGAIVLRYSGKALATILRPVGLAGTTTIILSDRKYQLMLDGGETGYMAATDSAAAPVGLSNLSLSMTATRLPFSAIELLQAFLPLLMWASAAVVAFWMTDRLLISPLQRLRGALAGLKPGAQLVMPPLKTPAREIRDLAATFDEAGKLIARHESDIAQSLADQVKLTREVHHRVKNNLQVVASLISLHARGAPDGPVAEAYASIQRRVDALAIVHRNHYAELEDNAGVSAKALIGELAANLRTGLVASGRAPSVGLRIATANVSQDVAVPIAFLLTELIELSIIEAHDAAVTITLDPPIEGLARLWIASAGLSGVAEQAEVAPPRHARIIEGLARQLRTKLEYDTDTKAYRIDIPVIRSGKGG
jgi:two-component system, sensor histidine kinase PdtaS